MKHLVIIPGVGDRHRIYSIAARWWSLFGYTTHIHVFGWNSADPSSKIWRQQALIDFVQSLEGDVYMLGVSAGGTAVINCFAVIPNQIQKVATLCSPLAAFKNAVNPLLEVCIIDVTNALSGMNSETKKRICSFHALYDQVVPLQLSHVHDLRTVPLISILHAPTIALGLTIFHLPILRFFKQR